MNWLTSNKIVTAANYADGSADVNCAIVDMEGYEGIVAIVHLAAIAGSGTNSIKWQQDTDSAMGTAADLLATGITVADNDDNQIFATELNRPTERYVRLVLDKDTSHNLAAAVHYILYGPKELPVTNNVTDLVTSEIHVSPAEGTA
jgi:outer membrane protein assembly factor BamB